MKFFASSFAALLPILAATAAKADTCNGVTNNLVQNCGFETGTFAGYTGTTTTNGFSGIDTGDPLALGTTPYQGSYEAYFGSTLNVEDLTQTLNTVPGQMYQIEFALLNDTTPIAPYVNNFVASFGTDSLLSISNATAGPYQLYTFGAVASSATTDLTFASQNQTGDFEVDSISVAPAAATPDPASWALLTTGSLMVVLTLRTRRKETLRSA